LLDGGVVRSIGAAASVSDQYVKFQLEDRNQLARNSSVKEESSGVMTNDQLKSASQPTNGNCSPMQDSAFGKEGFQKRAQHHRVSNGDAEIVNVQMLRRGDHSADFDFEDEAQIRVFVRFDKGLSNLNLSLKIRTLQGTDVAFFDTRLQDEMAHHYEAGKFYLFGWNIKLPLLHGNYALACGLAHPPAEPGADWQFVDVVPHAYEFRVAPRQNGMIDGFVTLPASLTINKIEVDSV
jgi:lipopolysaccharide transport system ATP-binding protein